MRKISGILALCLLTGCTSTETVYKNYDNLMPVRNGATAEQAKVIAQRALINTEEKDCFRLSFPDINTSPMALKYPDYWFVVFGHNFLEPFLPYPLIESYRELVQMEYVVVIDKKTGKILFHGEWFPKRENDFDWVFDPHAYNRKDPLVLPPYQHSRELL